jgi:hypothetical protein
MFVSKMIKKLLEALANLYTLATPANSFRPKRAIRRVAA